MWEIEEGKQMRKICVSDKYCRYKSDTGYCGYTGTECAKETVRSIGIIEDSPMVMVTQVELTDECIQRIAEAVAKKIRNSL